MFYGNCHLYIKCRFLGKIRKMPLSYAEFELAQIVVKLMKPY